MSTYAKAKGDKGNTTLKVKKDTNVHLAILDTRVGVSIITKETWKLWGKRALTSTTMGLQLADGEVKYPIGLLEDTSISICNMEITHNFAIVDFDLETNYEIILRRPFMRQTLVVQDWGYNCLYLRHHNAILQVNLDDHSYRDVTKSPIEDMDTSSYEPIRDITSEETQEEGAWLCDVYEHASIKDDIMLAKHLEMDEAYMPQPPLTDRIEEHVWMQVLSTIDVSALSKGTRFCNELGHDVEPILMILVKWDEINGIEPLYWAKDEISIRDLTG